MKREFEVKINRLRQLMEQQSLAAIYLKRQDNFSWLTLGGINYVGLGEMGNCGLLVTADGLAAITNNIEAPRMKEEEKLEALGFAIHSETWHQTAFEGESLRKLVPTGDIGFDHVHSMGRNIADAVKVLRFALTPEEVERYQEGGVLASRAIEETIASIEPGDTELKSVGRLLAHIRELGMDAASAMCTGDERMSLYRHPVPTGHRIQERVQMGANLRYKGLIICCFRLRNFVPVAPALRAQYRANVLIDCTLMANSIPGNAFVSALKAGKKAYEDLGYAQEFDKHHQGGPIGYGVRDYRVDFNTPGLIQNHQGFCWNPTITGTLSEDTVVVTENGIIPITSPVVFPTMEVEVNGLRFIRPSILEP